MTSVRAEQAAQRQLQDLGQNTHDQPNEKQI